MLSGFLEGSAPSFSFGRHPYCASHRTPIPGYIKVAFRAMRVEIRYTIELNQETLVLTLEF